MRPIVTFTVAHTLPSRIGRLHELCNNLYWSWNPTIREALRAVNPERWHRANHHPVRMLEATTLQEIDGLAADPAFLERYDRAIEELDRYRQSSGWYQAVRGVAAEGEVIAYFSAEFGLHESVPLYSGGLGVLSGDHTKSASDLALPFVCVGLMYQMGYFRQRLAVDGAQLESYDLNDPTHLLLNEVIDSSGNPLRISVDYPRGVVQARIWRLDVGRVPIYLLDTNIAENTIPEYRDIADNLYGGDQEVRVMQEIMLGIGGTRALRALGIEPTVTHSNEGHSAFLMLERTRRTMEEMAMSFEEASVVVASGSVFTTHTPVPAGNDAFSEELIDRYFSSYWPQLGLTRDEFLALGRIDPTNSTENFSMTVLALKMTSRRNGVSQLHGEVSRQMWHSLWPVIPAGETPIRGITNGVHTRTWVGDHVREIFDRYLGADWTERISNPDTWLGVDQIPDEELWHVKNTMRSDLVNYIHQRLDEQQAQWYSRSNTARDIERILDPNILTIGFARRFATYKRATLLFRDTERAVRLFTDPERPIQLVVAGKAHPKDAPGKDFIRKVIEFIRDQGLESRIVFTEDYDMGVARMMTQGCDVWLNTPRRPLEASGTSGMKAAVNGALNLSILDGWFPEGYDGTNGFAIGEGEGFSDLDLQDEFESRRLYRALEEEVIPYFYTRDEAGVPRRWVAMQKNALRTMAWRFSSDRMVQDYATEFYFPSTDRYRRMTADNGEAARALVQWKHRVRGLWKDVRIVSSQIHARSAMKINQTVNVVAYVSLDGLSPSEVRLEAWYGELDRDGLVSKGTPVALEPIGVEEGLALYSGSVRLGRPGHAGIALRAFPWHPDLIDTGEMDLMVWG